MNGEDEFELMLHDAGIKGWAREHEFATTIGRRWRFDFAFIDKKLAIEIDGGIWVQGRHSRGAGMEKDNEKINTAVLMGWRVLKFSTGQVKKGYALKATKEALA